MVSMMQGPDGTVVVVVEVVVGELVVVEEVVAGVLVVVVTGMEVVVEFVSGFPS